MNSCSNELSSADEPTSSSSQSCNTFAVKDTSGQQFRKTDAMLDNLTSDAMMLCYERPIVCTNGQLIRCCFLDQCYVPQEIVDRNELLVCLQTEMRQRKRRRLFTTPKDRATNKLNPRRRINSEPVSRENLDDGNLFRRTSISPITRGQPRPIVSPRPRSVLLKVTPKSPLFDRDSEEVFNSAMDDETACYTEKFKEQIDWARGTDYVSMERIRSLAELTALLELLQRDTVPAAIELRVNQDGSLTVCYQFVGSFKQEFMMLNLNSDYCFFMSPF